MGRKALGGRARRVAGLAGALVLGMGVVGQARVEVRLVSPTRTASPGDVAIHVFSISNRGSHPVAVTLSVELPSGWGQVGLPPALYLSSGEEETVFVTVVVPRAAPAGAHAVVLLASWEGGEAWGAGEVLVRAVAGIVLYPPPAGAAQPGEAIAYALTIANRGNVVDRVFIDATSAHGWAVRTQPREVALGPGESRTVELILSIPRRAEPGRDLLSVVVQSAEGAEARTSWYTAILPPGPEAIVGSAFASVEMTLGGRLGYDPIAGRRLSLLTLMGEGEVLGGALALNLQLTGPWGAAPYTVPQFSLRYRAEHVWTEVGEVELPLSSLLALGGQGMAGGWVSEHGEAEFLTGWLGDEGRFGLRGVWRGAWGNLGLAAQETRGVERVQAGSLWVTGVLLEGVAVRGEGAIALSPPFVDAGFLVGIDAVGGPGLAFHAEAYGVGPRVPSSRADRVGIGLSGQLAALPWGLRFTTRWERDNTFAVSHLPTVARSDLTVAVDWTPPRSWVAVFGTLSLGRRQRHGPGSALDRGIRGFGLATVIGDEPLVVRLTARWQWDEITGSLPEITDEYGQRFHLTLGGTRATLVLAQSVTRRGGAIASSAQVSLLLRLPSGVTADLRSGDRGGGVGVEVPFSLPPALSASLRFDVQWDSRGTVSSLSAAVGLEYAFVVNPPFLPVQGWVEGVVFVDENGDGRHDAGERGVGGVVLAVGDVQVSTGSDGRFLFPPLPPGRWGLAVLELPTGLRAGVELPLSVDVDLAGRTTVHIPCERLGQIQGAVFDDADRSGSREEREGGLARVRVTLEGEGVVREAFTGPLGQFAFADLGVGEYTVRVDAEFLPERYELTTPAAAVVLLRPGADAEVLFGAWRRPRPVVVVVQPPVADFEWFPQSPRAGEPVEFDASPSLGAIAVYEWDFTGDGQADAQGVRVVWRFADPGFRLVTLWVTGDGGLTDEVVLLVPIEP